MWCYIYENLSNCLIMLVTCLWCIWYLFFLQTLFYKRLLLFIVWIKCCYISNMLLVIICALLDLVLLKNFGSSINALVCILYVAYAIMSYFWVFIYVMFSGININAKVVWYSIYSLNNLHIRTYKRPHLLSFLRYLTRPSTKVTSYNFGRLIRCSKLQMT